MRKTIFAHLQHIILFFVFSIPLFILCVVPVNYRSISPGFNNNVEAFITIDTPYMNSGTFHTTSVLVPNKISSFQYIIGQYISTTRIYEIPEYLQDIDSDKLDQISYQQKTNSLIISYIYALEYADIPVEYTLETKVTLVFESLTANTLQEGDIILSVNDKDPLEELYTAECGKYHEFKINRNGSMYSFYIEKKDTEDGCLFGVQLSTNVTLDSTELAIDNNRTGGPSGGLMQALYIYNLKTEEDYSLGLKIAGTGTLDLTGDVGSVGGIEQKVYTAIYNDIDIFFVPYLSDDASDNYIRAKAVLTQTGSDMILIGVSSFDEAINYLQSRLDE